MLSIPNIITISRAVMAIILLAVAPFSTIFYMLYTLCGLSDIADGYIARRTGKESKSGEILDSLADMVFVAIMFIIMVPFIKWYAWVISWIIIIVLVRFLSLFVRYIKKRMLTPLHSTMNRVSGILLFVFIYLFEIMDTDMLILILCCFTTIAAVDELVKIILIKKHDAI